MIMSLLSHLSPKCLSTLYPHFMHFESHNYIRQFLQYLCVYNNIIVYTHAAHLQQKNYTSLIHVKLPHIKNSITLDGNEIWAWDQHHCAALIKTAKSLAPSNVIGHGKVHGTIPETSVKVYGAQHTSACISVMRGANLT